MTAADARRYLDAVRDCPDRGGSLPLAQQPYRNGCDCPELWACAGGKGKNPAGASLEECVRCRYLASTGSDGC